MCASCQRLFKIQFRFNFLSYGLKWGAAAAACIIFSFISSHRRMIPNQWILAEQQLTHIRNNKWVRNIYRFPHLLACFAATTTTMSNKLFLHCHAKKSSLSNWQWKVIADDINVKNCIKHLKLFYKPIKNYSLIVLSIIPSFDKYHFSVKGVLLVPYDLLFQEWSIFL